MMFGDPSRFAVELSLDERHGGPWLFGKYCYWVAGDRVGDFESGTSLRDILIQSESVRHDTGQRQHDEFFAAPAKAVARRIRDSLFGDRGSGQETELALREQWTRFDFAPRVDVFDQWFVFLVESGDQARILVQNTGSDEVMEFTLRAGECDDALNRALDCIHGWFQAEQPHSPGTPPGPASSG